MIFPRTSLLLFICCFLNACAEMAPPEHYSKDANLVEAERANYPASTSTSPTDDYAYQVDQNDAVTTQSPILPAIEGAADQYQQRILIKQAESRIAVANLSHSVQRIEQLLAAYGGYLSDMNMQQLDHRNEAVLSLRVPANYFHPMLDSLRAMALRVEQESIQADDVTEDFVDLQSRLDTKKQVQTRYEEILRTKAKTIEEVLETEEKIRLLQEEIEAKESRLRYLSSRAELSHIKLSMYENTDAIAAAVEAPTWYSDFLGDTKDALGGGFGILKIPFLLLLRLWPLLLLVGWLIFKRKSIRAFFSPANNPPKASSE